MTDDRLDPSTPDQAEEAPPAADAAPLAGGISDEYPDADAIAAADEHSGSFDADSAEFDAEDDAAEQSEIADPDQEDDAATGLADDAGADDDLGDDDLGDDDDDGPVVLNDEDDEDDDGDFDSGDDDADDAVARPPKVKRKLAQQAKAKKKAAGAKAAKGDTDAASPAAGRGERLQKVLALAGYGSRRECEVLITAGRVEIDGQVAMELGTRVDVDHATVYVDGEKIRLPQKVYYAVCKPAGVLSTTRDPDGRTRVIDLLPKSPERLFTVGRLDRASEGLILVTNDGDLAQRLAHPSFGVEKTYRVQVAGVPTRETMQQLRQGVYLAEGKTRVESITLESTQRNSAWLEMVLSEGKNREIRRVFAHVGHKVLNLRRISVGPLRLRDMQPGEVRKLTGDEVRLLYSATAKQKSGEGDAPRAKKPGGKPAGGGKKFAKSGPPPGGQRFAKKAYSRPANDDFEGDDGPPPPRGDRGAGRPAAGPRGRRPAAGRGQAAYTAAARAGGGAGRRPGGTGRPGTGRPGAGRPGTGRPGAGRPAPAGARKKFAMRDRRPQRSEDDDQAMGTGGGEQRGRRGGDDETTLIRGGQGYVPGKKVGRPPFKRGRGGPPSEGPGPLSGMIGKKRARRDDDDDGDVGPPMDEGMPPKKTRRFEGGPPARKKSVRKKAFGTRTAKTGGGFRTAKKGAKKGSFSKGKFKPKAGGNAQGGRRGRPRGKS